MQMGFFSSRATVRTMRMRSAFCAWVPWEKLRRATSRPARTSWRKTSMVLDEGPRVATIFARRIRAVSTGEAKVDIALGDVFMGRGAGFFLTAGRNGWYDQC